MKRHFAFCYRGRYTHRVAISNARLVSVDDQAVVFRTHGSDTASLSPTEFIGRFLQHVLPNQFARAAIVVCLGPFAAQLP